MSKTSSLYTTQMTRIEPNSFPQQSKLVELKVISTTWPLNSLCKYIHPPADKHMPNILSNHIENFKLYII